MLDNLTNTVHRHSIVLMIFFFNDTATTEIYTLSLHDALPILRRVRKRRNDEIGSVGIIGAGNVGGGRRVVALRSEEHTSELQSRRDLVCRLLLEKKKKSQKFHRRIF